MDEDRLALGVELRPVPDGLAAAEDRLGLDALLEELVRVLEHTRADASLDGLAEEDLGSVRLLDEHVAERVVELDAVLEARLALEKAGDKEGAEYERYLSQGMVASVLATGDGKTWKTAYEVYAVSEEYDVLFAAGLVKVDQGTIDGTTKDGKVKSFDVITARDPQTDATQRNFFNVTALYTHYGKLEDKKTMEDR